MSYSVSKTATRCQKCFHKEECEHKYMEMCAVAEFQTEKPLNIQIEQNIAQPTLVRECEKEIMKLLHRNMMYGA